ncbi:disulfide bond formation protein B [Polymorphobacter sp.]|uniref:disulfide bond formation protein B n=1 Tax=Polymorphobacter sp. TaxID=1909290 RepID=UPI003F6EC782
MPSRARVAVPAAIVLTGGSALLGGALAFQYWGGLAPCEMCLWQRWALAAALTLAALGWALGQRAVVALAALSVWAGAAIAAFHAGVEQKWWQGITTCAAAPAGGSTADVIGSILAAPLVRCDAIPWSLFGLSMAGWNVVLSTLIGGIALWQLKRS